MRPNIDIPRSVHGKVRKYAVDNHLNISKAYERLLREKLRGEGYNG